MNAVSTAPLLTGSGLYELGDTLTTELIKGKLRRMAPTGFLHGVVELNIGSLLQQFVTQQGLGRVMTGEVGIYTQRNPDTVRGVDVLYISHERLSKVSSDSYLDVAPELIVEVISPNDRWLDIERKLTEYFAIGVLRVWLADPADQTVRVYTADTYAVLHAGDILADESLFPGFSTPVTAFFA